MKKDFNDVLAMFLVFILPALCAGATATDHVVISEVFYDSSNESGSEFIELYNPTGSDIDIGNWTISTENSLTDATIPPGTSIVAYGFYLIADAGWSTSKDNSSWPDADHEELLTLSNSDAGVALRNPEGSIIDAIGWGNSSKIDAGLFEGTPALDVLEGHSLERKPGYLDPGAGNGQDTDNNSNDFLDRENPQPQSSASDMEIPTSTTTTTTLTTSTITTTTTTLTTSTITTTTAIPTTSTTTTVTTTTRVSTTSTTTPTTTSTITTSTSTTSTLSTSTTTTLSSTTTSSSTTTLTPTTTTILEGCCDDTCKQQGYLSGTCRGEGSCYCYEVDIGQDGCLHCCQTCCCLPETTTTTTTIPEGTEGVIIRAMGEEAGGELPVMQLWIDGVMKAEWSVLSNGDYVYEIYLDDNGHSVDVVFVNDYCVPEGDRNLYVDYIMVNSEFIDADDPSVIYDRGCGDEAFDGIDVIPGQGWMYWSGALRFTINGGSTTTTTTTLTTSTITTTTLTTSTTTTIIEPTTTTTIIEPTTTTTTTLTTTTTTTIIEPTTTTTLPPEECELLGDYPPCGEITLDELVDLINLWADGEATLSDIIDLINAWGS